MPKQFRREPISKARYEEEDDRPKRGPGRPRKEDVAATNGKTEKFAATSKAQKTKEEKIRIVSPIGMISYPFLVKPDEGRENSDGKFKCDVLIPKEVWKSDPVAQEMKAGILRCARKYFSNPDLDWGDFKGPIRNGAEKLGAEYQGCVFFTPKTQFKPTVVGPNIKEWDDLRASKIKGGDFARVVCVVYGYPNKGGGITLGLEVVQFSHEGDALGQGRKASVALLDEVEVELQDPNLEEMEEEDEEPVTRKRGRPVKAAAAPKTKVRGAAPVVDEDEDDNEDYAEDEDDDELNL